MDYDKLIDAVKLCGSTPKVDQCKQCAYWSGGDMSKCIPKMTEDAATAIETFRDENEKIKENKNRAIESLSRIIKLAYEQRDTAVADLARVTAERDAAVEKYEAEKEDFLDYALSGTQNAAPFCRNRHPDCVDKRGWCIPVKCHGFSRDKED